MKVAELRLLVEAMTNGRWVNDTEYPEYIMIGEGVDAVTIGYTIGDTSESEDDKSNASGIVALQNHAEALLRLAEAVVRLVDDREVSRTSDVAEALAALEAIP